MTDDLQIAFAEDNKYNTIGFHSPQMFVSWLNPSLLKQDLRSACTASRQTGVQAALVSRSRLPCCSMVGPGFGQFSLATSCCLFASLSFLILLTPFLDASQPWVQALPDPRPICLTCLLVVTFLVSASAGYVGLLLLMHTPSSSSAEEEDIVLVMGTITIKHTINANAWWCYFLLGAGILAPWNAFITATDFFSAVFPGAHVDRLFTVCYLPSCLLLLVVCVVGGEKQRWLWAWTPHMRISTCYIAFTLVMLLVPLVSTLSAEWYDDLNAPPGSLTCLMATVVVVGALDGACQGAVFSDAAKHGPVYTQAVASGTACSGLLVSFLRCACKAAWLASDAPPMSSLRASTALYFGLGAVLTASCWIVHASVLPRLVGSRAWPVGAVCSSGGAAANSHSNGRGFTGNERCLELADSSGDGGEVDCEGNRELATSSSIDSRRLLQRRVTSVESTPLLGGSGSSGVDAGVPAGTSPRHARHADGSTGGMQLSPHPDSEYAFVRESHEDDDVDDVVVLVEPLPCPSTTAPPPPPSFGTQESLISGSQGGGPREPWPQEAAQQLLHLHHRHQQLDSAASRGPQTALSHKVQMRAAFSVLRPYCISLFLTYFVTLSIFPGFLAEDVHSAELGEWYALIVITCFNAADLTGKLIGPNHESDVNDLQSGRGGLVRQALMSCSPNLLMRQPALLIALTVVRGLVLLAVFVGFNAVGAPPWLVITATVALGLSNGWFTVICMCACGPSLLPDDLIDVGEGLLVIALISGLMVGALCGWLWLIPAL